MNAKKDDKKNESPSAMGRRNFLKVAGAGGVAVVSASMLNVYQPWTDYGEANVALRNAESTTLGMTAFEQLAFYGTLAASGHNAQPWQFAFEQDSIVIRPDFERRLPAVDPENRELWMSLGCAVENIRVAAARLGYAAEVSYPETETDAIVMKLKTAESGVNDVEDRFEAIFERQSSRVGFADEPLSDELVAKIRSVAMDVNVGMTVILTDEEMAKVREFIYRGNLVQYADNAFVKELNEWMRFNKRSAMKTKDGLFSRCSGNPEVPSWLGRIFVNTMAPEQQAQTDDERMKQSAAVLILSSKDDDLSSWVKTGELYERLSLLLTQHGVLNSLMNQPVEVPALREEMAEAFELFGEYPQLVMRVGYGEKMPYSLRRDVQDVMA